MFSTLEPLAIIAIIVIQLIISVNVYKQILSIKSFLPNGRNSLSLKEYEIPADKILELEPSQVVDKRKYLVTSKKVIESPDVQPRKEKGNFSEEEMNRITRSVLGSLTKNDSNDDTDENSEEYFDYNN